jgi:hypothetical protein
VYSTNCGRADNITRMFGKVKCDARPDQLITFTVRLFG